MLPILLFFHALLGCGSERPDTAADPCAFSLACPEGLALAATAERLLPAPTTIPHGPVSVAVADLAGTGTRQVYVGTNSTVTRLDGDGWTTATDVYAQADDGAAVLPLIADFSGDGVLDLAVGLPGSDDGAGQVMVFPGPITDLVDWDMPHLELKGSVGMGAGFGLSAADLDGDGATDLLARGHGVVWVRFGPLLADIPFGSKGDAVWNDSAETDISGVETADIDGDGIVDLVFTTHRPVSSGWDLSSPGRCGQGVVGLRVAVGPLSGGIHSTEDAPLFLLPPHDVILLGGLWAGDVSGDGISDLLTLGLDLSVPGIYTASMLVYAGPIMEGAAPMARFLLLGSPAGIGDFDGDGTVDLLQSDLLLAGAIAQDLVGPVQSSGPAVLRGPLDALPGFEGCAIQVAETWTSPTELRLNEASWVGDLDGNGLADAVLATTGDKGEGLVQVVVGGDQAPVSVADVSQPSPS